MTDKYTTVDGYKIPNPDHLETPDTNTEKIPLGDNSTTTANDQTIHNIVAAIHNRMAEGLAPLVLITGESQMGKTWTGLRIAYELHEITKAAHGEFTKDNILYEEEEALSAMTVDFKDGMPAQKQVLLADELGEQANANTHNSTSNMAWKMILNVMPVLGNCVIGLDPQSKRIDAKIRDKPNYRIWMVNQGVAAALGRRYRKTTREGNDQWTVDYFNEWNVPKPPKRYREMWKPKELRYKLKQPIDYLKKLQEDKGDTSSLADL